MLSSQISWAELLQVCLSKSKQPLCSQSLESELMALCSHVREDDQSLFKLFTSMDRDRVLPYRTHLLLEEDSCKVMLILLQKGAEVGLHNHPNQHGFIYCLQGPVLVEAFDEHSATQEEAVLKRVLHRALNKGEHTYLTPNRANIHSLYGLKKSFLLDIFMPPLHDDFRDLCRRYERPHEELGEELCLAKIIPKD